jgi:predicted nucleotidyltransferase
MQKPSSSSVRVFYPRYSRAELVEILRQRVAALAERLPLARAVLFGSWAKGLATAFSDIDLLIVYAGPPRADAYAIVWDVVNLRGLEPHVYAEAEAEAVASVIERMARGGVDLMDR